MAKLGGIKLTVERDVKKGEETSVDSLLSWDERRKEFKALEDVERFGTKIKVEIPKVGTWQTRADITRKKGEKTSLYGLLPWIDHTKALTASEDIKKGAKLEVSFETV